MYGRRGLMGSLRVISVLLCLLLPDVAYGIPRWTNSDYNIQEGRPFTLMWTGAQGPVTISLMSGSASNLSPVQRIASGLTGTSFTWTPAGIPSGTYSLAIEDATGPNYGIQFQYVGTGSVGTTTPLTTSQAPTTPAPTTPAPTTPAPTAPTPTTPSTSGSQPPPDETGRGDAGGGSNGNGDGGLSPGAKAGIGVGAGVGGIALVVAVGFLMYRRGRAAAGKEAAGGAAELGADPASKPELGGQAVSEIYSPHPAAELGTDPIAKPELDGQPANEMYSPHSPQSPSGVAGADSTGMAHPVELSAQSYEGR